MRYAITIASVACGGLMWAFTVGAFAKPAQPAPASPQTAIQAPKPPQRCLRALDGSCTNLAVVDSVRRRAIIFSTIRVSYYGTPAGTIPGGIGIERFFRDDPVLFGLPTVVYGPGPCCILRTK
ncbi:MULTISPECIES: hypothetical protein [unclassified Nitrobacter]|uniref:hypothetical protein n=1 Tax=unclassified Nitrobacter TaxID=2620411 RepID=UPI000927D9A3|nr:MULTISPECIES: hypothetical protein [unclassified Nitrobacter]MBN9147163.1 hypothetical protein [Nitrobacter sp.]OJV02338.1 MAG: hypothetical protein BGO16_01960 [Nitrobacter sp. 62-23]